MRQYYIGGRTNSEKKSMAENVRQQLTQPVSEEDVIKIIQSKVEESEKEVADRQSRERNIVFFGMPEPNTNLIKDRQKKDLETIDGIIQFLNLGNDDLEVAVEKIIRLGARHKEYQQNPRPVLVTFTNFQAKKCFLRNSKLLNDSADEVHKKISIANDMTKKHREKELELVNQKKEKNSSEVGPWKYVIRGPPGDRKICKNKKTLTSIPMLKCFYTNCDTLTNKMDELLFYINTKNPDIY